jgi:hypothetical protein
MNPITKKPSPTPAERMRVSRIRRRNGLRCFRVVLHETQIDSLMLKGFLKPARRTNPNAIQDAIDGFICFSLGHEGEES